MSRKIIVGVVLIIGFLMTYLSRIPLAFERGANWIWSYIPAGDPMAWFLFNVFHGGSLVPLALFGFSYLRGKVKWTFHAAALAHFVTTAFLYYDYQARYAEDVISFVVFPGVIAFVVFVVGGVVYFIERKTAVGNRIGEEGL
jgi:hypothetical protein